MSDMSGIGGYTWPDPGVPEKCPISGRKFFMMIRDGETFVPTYGGPFDSYTIPVPDGDGGYECRRYDHDAGGWVEGWERVDVEEGDYHGRGR